MDPINTRAEEDCDHEAHRCFFAATPVLVLPANGKSVSFPVTYVGANVQIQNRMICYLPLCAAAALAAAMVVVKAGRAWTT